MAVKLIAFDLDGTILDSKKHISEANMAVLKEAKERGIIIVPASGRMYPGIPEELKNGFCRYFIMGNGLTAYDAQEDSTLFEIIMDQQEVSNIMDYAEEHGMLFDSYVQDTPYMSKSILDSVPVLFSEDPAFVIAMNYLRRPVSDLRTWLASQPHPVQKMALYYTDLELRRRHLKELPELFKKSSFTTSVYCNIEIVNKLADKGIALKKLCSALGIPVEEAMAIGDGLNDAGMLSTAGVGVAMGNAENDVKEYARYVTGSCDGTGFADAVRKFALCD